MTDRFNCIKVPTWTTLTDSERYHVHQLARILDDSETVSEWLYGRTIACTTNRTDRQELWACESLLTALTSSEPVTAFRALLTATAELERVHDAPTWAQRDAACVAKDRIERWLGKVTP